MHEMLLPPSNSEMSTLCTHGGSVDTIALNSWRKRVQEAIWHGLHSAEITRDPTQLELQGWALFNPACAFPFMNAAKLMCPVLFSGGAIHQHSDALGLLSPRFRRRCCRATEECEEFASSHLMHHDTNPRQS